MQNIPRFVATEFAPSGEIAGRARPDMPRDAVVLRQFACDKGGSLALIPAQLGQRLGGP